MAGKQGDVCTLPPSLKSLNRGLTGFSHIYHACSLHTSFLSQGCVLRVASGNGEGKQDAHFKDREGLGSSNWPRLANRTIVAAVL